VVDAWETLTFNFANQAPGTAALNPAFTFNKVSIFFDFGVTGAAAGGARTYYCDDVRDPGFGRIIAATMRDVCANPNRRVAS
jgi:hypothetical protein